MNARQKQVVQMYQRVQDFLGANAPPTTASFTVQKQVLDEVVAKLSDHSTDRGSAQRLTRASTQRQAALRAQLRTKHLAPIAQIARANLSDVPGIAKALKMPSSQIKTHNLVDAAGVFRKAAAPYEGVFVEAGRPQDVLAQLDAAIAELNESLIEQARSVGLNAGAKRGFAKELKRGRKAVELIDTMVAAAFGDKPDVLGKWRSAKRVRGVPSGIVGAIADTPAPATATDPKPAAA